MIHTQGSEGPHKCLWAENLSCQQCAGTLIVAALTTITLLAGVLLILAQNGYNLGGIGTIAHQIGPQWTYVGMGVAGTLLALDIAFIVALARRPSAPPPQPYTPLSTPLSSPQKTPQPRRTLDRLPSSPSKLNQPGHLQVSSEKEFQAIPLCPGQYMTANYRDATTKQMKYALRAVSWKGFEQLLPFDTDHLRHLYLGFENILELVDRRLCDTEVRRIAEKENLSSECNAQTYWECELTIGNRSIPAAIFHDNGNFPYMIWQTTEERESYFEQNEDAGQISFNADLSVGDFSDTGE